MIAELLPSLAILGLIVPLIGLVILAASLVPLRRLMAIIPDGSLRNKWRVMNGLILFFIVAYLAYIVQSGISLMSGPDRRSQASCYLAPYLCG